MGEFVNLFDGHLSRKQVRTFIQQLVDNQILISEGKGYGTSYSLGNDYKKKDELMNKAFIPRLRRTKKTWRNVKRPSKDQARAKYITIQYII